MKKIISITSIVLLCTVAFAGGTDKGPKSASGIAVTRNSENGLFKVHYKAEESADVKISIFNSKNEKVFSEKLKSTDGFIRPYNFASLPEGEYTIRVEDGNAVQLEKVLYQSGSVEKLVQVRSLGKDGKFLFTASGSGQERVTVNIYDGADKLLYTETELVKNAVAKVFDVTKVKDHVSFEIVHANGKRQRVQF